MAKVVCAIFDAPEAKSFHLRLLHQSGTKNILPSGHHCMETNVPLFPSAAGFKCTTWYWPNWDSNRIKISVAVSRTHSPQKHKVLAARIDLPGKTGLPGPQCNMSRALEPVMATGDVEGGVSLIVPRDDVKKYCVVEGHFTAIFTVVVSSGAWPPPPLPITNTLACDISTASDLVDGLDTLRAMCEELLCASVSVCTVLSSLVFAEERTCPKLKSRCLDFLAVGENFLEVAVTNEYLDLMKDAPSLLAEVQNWFKKPRLS